MSYDSAEQETQESYFGSENCGQTFFLEESVYHPSAQPEIDVSMSCTSDIEHIDSNIPREGPFSMYTAPEQQQMYESVAQEGSNIPMARAVDYYTYHGPLSAYGHSQTLSQETINYHASYDGASTSSDSACLEIAIMHAGAPRGVFDDVEANCMDYGSSATEENPYEYTDSVAQVEAEISSMVRGREHLDDRSLLEEPDYHYLEPAGIASDQPEFEVFRPEHKLDRNNLQWEIGLLNEMRQTPSEEQMEQILKDYIRPLGPAGIDSSNTSSGHPDISALSSHHQVDYTDPVFSINAFEQNVDNLLASSQIITAPTHLLSLTGSRPEEVFSGVGYPPRFQLLSRQPVECHNANVPQGSAIIHTGVSNHSTRLDPQPSQPSSASAVTSATSFRSNTNGLHCSNLLPNGCRCNAYFKGRHARSHLGRHTRLKHKDKFYVCEYADCEKKYTRRSYLSKHHERDHPKPCSVCQLAGHQQNQCTQHGVENGFKCQPSIPTNIFPLL